MDTYYRNNPNLQRQEHNDAHVCPFCNNIITELDDDYNDKQWYKVIVHQGPQDINRIMALINEQFRSYYTELQGYRIQRPIARNIFRSIVRYVLNEEGNYTGGIEQKTNRLFNTFSRDNLIFIATLRGYGVPINRITQIIKDIIRFTLQNLEKQPPVEQPTSGWSRWEDLGGVLTSAPAVSSWQSNRLDVFGRGQNNALWHKWWDGSSWSGWEDLGGILTSAPAAVSWGPNRIDVFGRGQNNRLWHKWWDGSKWSGWEDLGGGTIMSGPAAASTGANRLEVFARGANNQLLLRTWNGRRWSGWQTLGGQLTSEPAAVSWGGNRLDVFTKGQNNHLWHIWRP